MMVERSTKPEPGELGPNGGAWVTGWNVFLHDWFTREKERFIGSWLCPSKYDAMNFALTNMGRRIPNYTYLDVEPMWRENSVPATPAAVWPAILHIGSDDFEVEISRDKRGKPYAYIAKGTTLSLEDAWQLFKTMEKYAE